MGKINHKDVEEALEIARRETVEAEVGLAINRDPELFGGRQTNKTPEGLAKKEDKRVYGGNNNRPK